MWARPVLGIFANRIALELERRLAEQRLHASETHNRLIIDTALDAVISIDHAGVITAWNSQAEHIFGYSSEETIHHSLAELIIPPQHREAHQKGLQHFHQTGQGAILNQRVETTALHQDGHEFPVELSIVPLHYGNETSFSAFVRDITERRQSEDEMTRLRRYLKNIIDSMPSVLVGVDTSGLVTEWNQQAEALTGISHERALGSFFADVLPQLDSELSEIRDAIHSGTPWHGERLLEEQNGQIRYSDVVVYPLHTDSVKGAVIRVDDVTSRVRMEQMMVQTEKMMSLGGLAAGMAHEINNPLSAILQATQNIQRRISPDLAMNLKAAETLDLDLHALNSYFDERGLNHFVEDIADSGKRAAKIVTDMLSFSRSSDTQLNASNLNELAEAAVRLAASDYDLKKNYNFKRIHIDRRYSEDLPPVACDGIQIEQVVLNLVKNAAHAMAAAATEKPVITLFTHSVDGYACIDIIDNGPGMDPEISKRVFEPFFTTKDVGKGTGLGLSVSYFIVTEQHDGLMSVETAPGKGACFKICLPYQQANNA